MQGPWIISGPLAVVELSVLGSPSGESQGGGVLSLRSFVASMEKLAARAATSDAAVWSAGEALDLAYLGVLGCTMSIAPTLGAALRCFANYFGTVQSATAIRIEQDNDRVQLHYRILDENIWPRRADAELTLGIVASTIRRYAPDAGRSVSVQFEGGHAASNRAIEMRLQRPVLQGDDNTIAFPARLLDARLPVPAANASAAASDFREGINLLNRHLGCVRAMQPVSARVQELLLERTGQTAADQDSIARALAMSRRTLRRKLEAEGTSFLELNESCRCSIGRALLLRTELPLVEIAMRLGYSDHTAFSRAFSRWCGVPPGALRKTLTGASATT